MLSSPSGKAGEATPNNAWSRPLQKTRSASAYPRPPPGIVAANDKVNNNAQNPGVGPNSPQNVLRERFLQLSLSMAEQPVVVTLRSGDVIEGIMHTFTPFDTMSPAVADRYVIKACKLVTDSTEWDTEGSGESFFKEGCNRIIPANRVSSVHVKSVNLDTGANNGNSKPLILRQKFVQGNDRTFKTDKEISVSKGGHGRDLVAAGSVWTSGGISERRGLASVSSRGGSLQGHIGQWDQFKANEDLFDVRATFDENLYTTELDKSQFDRQKIEEAHRLAKEIESTGSSNIHISEERGHAIQGDYDEEDLYSGVLKDNSFQILLDDKKLETIPKSVEASMPQNPKEIAAEKSETTAFIASTPQRMNYAAAAAKADNISKVMGPPPGIGVKPPSSPTLFTAPENAPDILDIVDIPDTTVSESSSAEPKEIPHREEIQSIPFPATSVSQGKKAVDSSNETKGATLYAIDNMEESAVDMEREKGKVPIDLKPRTIEEDSNKKLASGEDIRLNTDVPKNKVLSSKLNVNAKAFNPAMKSITPETISSGIVPPDSVVDVQMIDPASGIPAFGAYGVPQITGQSPYLQIPSHVGQPGMMPMVNTLFSNSMRYPGSQYPEPHHLGQNTQQMQSALEGNSTAPANPSNEDPITQQQSHHHNRTAQQPQVSVSPYNVAPPGAATFYRGNVGMHTTHARGPSSPHASGFHHQLVGGPQQIPVVPGAGQYSQMYGHPAHLQQPGGIPNIAQMHVPGGSPAFYQNPNGTVGVGGGMHYPTNTFMGHRGLMEDGADQGYRGSGGRGSGRAGGGRGRGRSCRKNGGRTSVVSSGGRGFYQGQNSPSGGNGGQLDHNGSGGTDLEASKSKAKEGTNEEITDSSGGGKQELSSTTEEGLL